MWRVFLDPASRDGVGEFRAPHRACVRGAGRGFGSVDLAGGHGAECLTSGHPALRGSIAISQIRDIQFSLQGPCHCVSEEIILAIDGLRYQDFTR